jgi:hypothetical protein
MRIDMSLAHLRVKEWPAAMRGKRCSSHEGRRDAPATRGEEMLQP